MIQLPNDADRSGRRLGEEELALLAQVIESGTLNCTRGTMVSRMERDFARRYAHDEPLYCVAVTSGTAAIHTAMAAIDPEPGDEIITTSVTDMGALAPILYQGAVPVFADIDPASFNVTAETIWRVLSPRTKAIIVTHLFGAPCEMEPILQLGRERGLPVIEDAAQAPFALYQGRRAGTLGTIGCFSLQQGKHMTCGEGGLVITADPSLARRMTLFHDKAWGYGDAVPDHYFLALNYRMTELQGAVAVAQLDKVEEVVRCRRESAAGLTHQIRDLPGIAPQLAPALSEPVFWKYTLRTAGLDVCRMAAFLRDNYGISSSPRYVRQPAFECEIFRERRTFGNSGFPFDGPHRAGLPSVNYRAEDYPGTYQALNHMLVLPWNENYTEQHVEYIGNALRHAIEQFQEPQ